MLTHRVILPRRIRVWAVGSTRWCYCAAVIAYSLPIATRDIGLRGCWMWTTPDCIERNRSIIPITAARIIRSRGGCAWRSPPYEGISASGRCYRGKCQRYAIGLCLRWGCTASSVGIVGYRIGLHGFFGISAIAANRNCLSTGSRTREIVCFVACRADHRGTRRTITVILMLCTAVLLIFSRLCVWAVLIGGIVSVITILCSAVLACGIISPIPVAIRTVCRAGWNNLTASITDFLPIATRYIVCFGRRMVTRPYRIQSDGCVCGIWASCAIRSTCRRAWCWPPEERISASGWCRGGQR